MHDLQKKRDTRKIHNDVFTYEKKKYEIFS